MQKITDYFEYRDLQTALAATASAQEKAEQAVVEMGETPPQFEEPKRLLEEFYKGEERKWPSR